MKSLNGQDRDEFLKALEEARRAALDRDEAPSESVRPDSAHTTSFEFRRVIDDMAGRFRSYVSARLLSRLYAENGAQQGGATGNGPAPPPLPPRSEHDTVLDELHLTSSLTAADLIRLRREFAKINHPDRVLPPGREQATRRMTIANSVIDEALRAKRTRAH